MPKQLRLLAAWWEPTRAPGPRLRYCVWLRRQIPGAPARVESRYRLSGVRRLAQPPASVEGLRTVKTVSDAGAAAGAAERLVSVSRPVWLPATAWAREACDSCPCC